MSYEEPRDAFGNVSTPYGAIKGLEAGVNPYDTAADAYSKIHGMEAMNNLARQGLLPASSSTGLAKAFLIVVIGFVIMVGIAFYYPWLKRLRDPAAMWERYSVAWNVAARREQFSDFASVTAWPQDVQKMVARKSNMSLAEIVAEIPAYKVLSKKKQEETGATLWFRLSAHGSETNAAFKDLQEKTIKTKHGIQKLSEIGALQYRFLAGRCKQGVEVACIDGAKAIASVTFHTIYTYGEEKAITNYAIKQLPQQGQLASAPAIVELRSRLEAYK